MVKIDPSVVPERPTRRRMILGTCVLVLGQFAIAGSPVISALDLPDPWGGVLTVIVVFLIPDLSLVAAIAIWGKAGYLFIKAKVFAFLKRGLPPDTVGPVRYTIGLVMFTLPIMFAWVGPYLGALAGESLEKTSYAVAGDVIFIASFFVLGGDFWDKIRSLFVREAVVQLPRKKPA
jgi:hypothetical protein